MKIIVLILVGIIILSFILIIIEDNSIRNFSAFFYRYGISIYKTTINIGSFAFSPEEASVITREEGVFHFSEDGKVYFRSNQSKFTFRLRTPFLFKATGTISDINHLRINARLPLSATILSVAWFILGIILVPFFGLLPLFFSLFPILLFLISLPVEKTRMDKMVKELKEILATYSYTPSILQDAEN